MTRDEFAENINILNNLVPKHAKIKTEEEIEIYYKNLKDLSKESFSKAIGDLLLNKKSFFNFPTIREIRELCYKYDRQALILKKVFQKILLDTILYKKEPEHYQNIIIEIINKIGGWNSLKDIYNNEEEKQEKEYNFITLYMQDLLQKRS